MTQVEKLTRLILEVPPITAQCVGRAQGKRYYTARHIAEQLIKVGVTVPPCKVGAFVYFLLSDHMAPGGYYISKERVTEVGSRGFFISDSPKTDNIAVFTSWDELDKSVFLTREEAERVMRGEDSGGEGCEH